MLETTTMTLSDTQSQILREVAEHEATLATLPKIPAAARNAVFRSMLKSGLLAEVPASPEHAGRGWRQDEADVWIALHQRQVPGLHWPCTRDRVQESDRPRRRGGRLDRVQAWPAATAPGPARRRHRGGQRRQALVAEQAVGRIAGDLDDDAVVRERELCGFLERIE
jgi:hypothetical protein